MKKLLITLKTLVFVILLLSMSKGNLSAQKIVLCPSGDKYICLDSHDQLGTVYRGKGKVIVIE
ncbi:MAG: hypothetical protein ACXIUD_10065 [Mongoliitalea sp.]